MDIHVNYLAIFVSAVACFFLGWAWHSPLLFQKRWAKEMGHDKLSKKEKEKMMKMMPKSMVGNFITLLITAYVMAYLIPVCQTGFNHPGLAGGLMTGGWIWFGFIATALLNTVLWEGRSWTLYAINVGHHLVALLLMGAILAAWV